MASSRPRPDAVPHDVIMPLPADIPPADHRFPKRDRLLRRSEFLDAQARGKRSHAPHFTLVLRPRADANGPRLGVTASRKAANSVGRNRVRRLVREVFRLHRAAFPAGVDCVVIVRENVPDLAFATVRDEILSALNRRTRSNASPPRAPDEGPSSTVAGASPRGPGRP